MPNLNETINKNKQNWYIHIKRMDKNRIPRQMLDYRPRGHRNVGRPKRRWIDDISFDDGKGQ